MKLFFIFNFLIILTSHQVNAKTISFESTNESPTLVELYTSEGCSSCPPAEHWFSQLKKDKRLWITLFPVAFHVDYWDYLGWQDPFASPQFSLRQRKYERYGYTKNVATPGFVIDGKDWNGWFRGEALPQLGATRISDRLTPALKTHLKVEMNNLNLRVDFSSPEDPELVRSSPKAHVAILAFDIVTPVKGGENSGRDLKHDFVVVGYQNSHMLETAGAWQVNLKRPDTRKYETQRQAAVIWVSNGEDPAAIQVTGGWLTGK